MVGNSGCSPGVLPGDDQVGEQLALVSDMQLVSTAPSTWQALLTQNSAHGGYYQLADLRVSQPLALKQMLLWVPRNADLLPKKTGHMGMNLS